MGRLRRWPRRSPQRVLIVEGVRTVAAALVVARAQGWRLRAVHRVDGGLEIILDRSPNRVDEAVRLGISR